MRTYIALGITILWAISYLEAIITNDYTGVSALTPIALLGAGYLLRNGTDHHDDGHAT